MMNNSFVAKRSDVRAGDRVLFAERSNEFLCVTFSKSFGTEIQGNRVLIARHNNFC